MTDFHVHTNLCDGKDSAAEMAKAAYEKGFSALGFSGHSFVAFDDCCMTIEDTEKYCTQIEKLKTEYRGKMEIYCGIEQDYFSNETAHYYDYIIGSVHYIFKNDKYYSLDESPEQLQALIDECYGGDCDALAEDYFELMSNIVTKTNADIIGHLDLITKFSSISKNYGNRYKTAALKAIKSLIPFNKPFEINVGAMTRRYKNTPYPAKWLLEEICREGGNIILSGDCHNKDYLGMYLDDAKSLALDCGFKTHLIIKNGKFTSIPL